MAGTRKVDLDPRTKKILIAVGAGETVLKIIALVDLIRRPKDSVRGSKIGWATAIATINSAGAVPIGYFLFGRRRTRG
jgi:hypothetical protein